MIETHEGDLTEARRAGWDDGDAFALALFQRELQERQDRLTRLALGANIAPAGLAPRDSAAVVAGLQRDLENLSNFHEAVLRSRAWIFIQRVRRLVGRAW